MHYLNHTRILHGMQKDTDGRVDRHIYRWTEYFKFSDFLVAFVEDNAAISAVQYFEMIMYHSLCKTELSKLF